MLSCWVRGSSIRLALRYGPVRGRAAIARRPRVARRPGGSGAWLRRAASESAGSQREYITNAPLRSRPPRRYRRDARSDSSRIGRQQDLDHLAVHPPRREVRLLPLDCNRATTLFKPVVEARSRRIDLLQHACNADECIGGDQRRSAHGPRRAGHYRLCHSIGDPTRPRSWTSVYRDVLIERWWGRVGGVWGRGAWVDPAGGVCDSMLRRGGGGGDMI